MPSTTRTTKMSFSFKTTSPSAARQTTALEWCLLVIILLHHVLVSDQSSSEQTAILFGGESGATSMLPYVGSAGVIAGSSTQPRRVAKNRYPRAYPNHTQLASPGQQQQQQQGGGGAVHDSTSMPVLHFVFNNLAGILGPSQRPTSGSSGQSSSSSSGSGGASGRAGGWGGGRLLDPPNRSSLWRSRLPGAPINLRDNHLDCGADNTRLTIPPSQGPFCGVCGDSPTGPQNHVLGGSYVSRLPRLTRSYTSGDMVPMTFFLNHTIIPGADRVTFSLCPVGQGRRDINWECVGGRGALQMYGWGYTYLPRRPGVHRVYVQMPRNFYCPRCVLQWRWQSSYLADWDLCASKPWLRACRYPIQYVNCADVTINRRPFINDLSPLPLFLLASSGGS